VHESRLHALALSAVGALAVASTPATAEADSRQPVTLRFAAVAGDAPVSCGAPIAGLGMTGATAQLADLRFYVSDVRLLRRDGRPVTLRLLPDSSYRVSRGSARTTMIDLENGTGACTGDRGTNAVVRGTVPAGRYVGVRLTLGVPFALNHTDTPAAPAPLNNVAMAWSWQFGRKFTKIEVVDPARGEAGLFAVHVGSTGCEGNPATGQAVRCRASNRATIRLRRFDPRRQRIAVDVKSLLAGTDVTAGPGCHSGPTAAACGGPFRALGIDWRADGSGSGRSPAGPAQTVFRAVR
jgi:uncharacterized repeat protein (TIGR04052 family)